MYRAQIFPVMFSGSKGFFQAYCFLIVGHQCLFQFHISMPFGHNNFLFCRNFIQYAIYQFAKINDITCST